MGGIVTFERDFLDDGYDYSECYVPRLCWLNDCVYDSGEYNRSECGFYRVDCAYYGFPGDGFNYSEHEADNPCVESETACATKKGTIESRPATSSRATAAPRRLSIFIFRRADIYVWMAGDAVFLRSERAGAGST